MRKVFSRLGYTLLPGLALLALAAGCAPKTASFQVPAGEPGVAIEASSFEFTPNLIRTPAGMPLLLKVKNTAGMQHNLTILDLDGKTLASVDLPAGQVTDIQLPTLKTGNYPFYCDKPLHTSLGMKGEIRAELP